MSNKTIVWIEQEIAVIEAVIKPLCRAGITFVKCQSYSEAQAHEDDIRQCDLILLGLVIPPGSSAVTGDYLGLAILHWLRTELGLPTPVIVLSPVASQKRREIEAFGAVALDQPVLPSTLKDEVWKLLRLPSESEDASI